MLFYIMLAAADEEIQDFAERMYIEYRRAIYKYHYKRLRNKDEAEYATTDTFIRMMANIEDLMNQTEENQQRYMFGYARLSFLTMWRKKMKESELDVFSLSNAETNDNGEIFDMDIPDKTNILASILEAETIEFLAEAIKKLKPTAQQIVILKLYYGARNTEIAEQLHMNGSTVSTVLQRSLLKIRKELEKYLHEQNQ